MPRASRILPDQDYLRICFDYDPETGVIRWRTRPLRHFAKERAWRAWNTSFAGRECRNPGTRGYLRVKIGNQDQLLHRVIWKWMTGDTPETVDHKNHRTDDNRWENLRVATIAENTRHMSGHRDRKYPDALKGAYRHNKGWLAFIGLNGKQRYLGYYRTEQAAHDAYCEAARGLFGEFWQAE